MARRSGARPSRLGRNRGRTPQSGVESRATPPVALVAHEGPLPQWPMPRNPHTAPTDGGPARAIGVVLFGRIDLTGAISTADEDAIAAAWSALLPRVQRAIETHSGLLLPTAPGPVLAGFETAPAAANAALALHRLCRTSDRGRPAGQQLRLCIGLHAPTAVSGSLDPQVLGVDVAASLAGLAEPGETVAGTVVRDQLTDGLDAQVQDLGDCYLKYLSDPVRAYRLGTPEAIAVAGSRAERDPVPRLAVVPLSPLRAEPGFEAVGELIADRLNSLLGRSHHVRIISRLSASPFARRTADPGLLHQHLGARYVLNGTYKVVGQHLSGQLEVDVRLIDTVSGTEVWRDLARGAVGELLSSESALVHRIGSGAHHAILEREVDSSLQQPILTLDNYALLLSGIMLMHRSSGQAFERSREALEALLQADAQLHLAHAWLAKWYVLKVTRSLSTHREADARAASRHALLALAAPGGEALANAMRGFVQLHLERRFQDSLATIGEGLRINPSEPLAWLFRSVAHSFLDQPDEAVHASTRALELSPLDPLLYYFESLAASSHISAGQHAEAIRLCERSLRRNVTHLHTHRALITALWADGQQQRARDAGRQLLLLKRDYTVAEFERNATSANTRFGQLMSEALRGAGVPMV
jgi:adenylate cyclase